MNRTSRWMSLPLVIALLLVFTACGDPSRSAQGDADVVPAGSGGSEGCAMPGYDPNSDASPPPAQDDECEEPTDDGPTNPDEGVVGCYMGPSPSGGATEWEPCPTEDPSGPGYQLVKVRDGLVDPHPTDWRRAVPREGGKVLRLIFWSGIDDCYGVADVEVIETTAKVEVTLIEGRVPTADACIEIAVKKAVDVPLDEPLGDRRVVDGAE